MEHKSEDETCTALLPTYNLVQYLHPLLLLCTTVSAALGHTGHTLTISISRKHPLNLSTCGLCVAIAIPVRTLLCTLFGPDAILGADIQPHLPISAA